MNQFIDGPAHGITLTFPHAPVYIRAVLNAKGDWDVLNLPTDEPAEDETLHAYKMEGEPIRGFISKRGKGNDRGGPFTAAKYHYLPNQPTDDIMRDRAKWVEWVMAQEGLNVPPPSTSAIRNQFTPPFPFPDQFQP